ncbi:hypothetical protein K7J14_09290 [Treponema zuelzerae]|uniref:Capsule assembly Wzi family protein n=1 Tax=Teretinema zuelzerae TaxID=156 RepID=A0AAE3EJE4_9SPIR|nr:hypothetical protein [Teretinema zuelzerae]MCD1654891.1 hypothetical protein [Teretinema zuelzerae]
MRIRNTAVIALLFIVFSSSVFSQVSADPDDFFYTDLNRWETLGLVTNLPSSRPYPMQMVKEILQIVLEKGDNSDRAIAREHLDRIFGRVMSPGVRTEAAYNLADSSKQLGVAMALDANYQIEDFFSVSASIDGWAINRLPNNELLPSNTLSSKDLIEDQVKAGPFYILPSINSSFSVGNTEYYAQAGLMRGSWGPIHSNGVILPSSAFHTGQYTVAINKEKWGFDTALYSLVATSIDNPVEFNPEKFLAVHSIDWRPYRWLSFSLVESVVYGNRIEPLYLLPFSVYFTSQGLVGFADNSMIGGTFSVLPAKGVKIDGVLYTDDIGFNDVIRFNKDQKWRIAGQLAASWAPKIHPMLRFLKADYTMVTPYTYSHKESDSLDSSAPNYQNYTHAGQALGASLEPNSDRLNLSVTVTPLEKLDVDIVGTLIRHGNVNENIQQDWVREYVAGSLDYVTDGSVNNSSYTKTGHAYNHGTPFLTQDTLQYIWQTGFDVKCRLPVLKTGGYMLFKLGYRFELNLNDGINSNVYASDSSLDPDDTAAVDAAAAAQLAEWKANAGGREIDNIITVGFEYYY